MEMSITDLQALLTVKQVADRFDVPVRVVRKAAKATPPTIPGVLKVLGKIGFDPDLVATWTPPEAGTRVVAAKRPDGRQRYRIYLSQEEAAKLLAEGYELADPRVAAAERRKAKKAAKSGESSESTEVSDGDDLFADFGA